MSDKVDDRFDGMYMNVAQQIRGVEPLLESVFSFLRRKTDFFTGAAPDKIEETVLKVIRREMAAAEREEAKRQIARKKAEEDKARKAAAAEEARRRKERAAAAAAAPAAEPVATAEVMEPGGDGTFDTADAADIAKPGAIIASAAATTTEAARGGAEVAAAGVAAAPAATVGGEAVAVASASDEAEDEEGGESKAPPGNGGRTDNYVWTQTLSELSVVVPVPPGTKSREIVCDITNRRLKVALKGADKHLIDGELHQKVIVDDCCWTLEDGKEVNILLQKENKMEWWNCVIKGDPEIDTTKVVPENSKLDDLDADTRKTVEKMMFDQRQKALGLPTADEMSKQEILNKFMKQHPEMDFSKAKIS